MNDKLVSIIVPVYNAEKYIYRLLDSLLQQTYKNIEIIVVDDGSIDNSFNIVQNVAAADNRVKVFHQENGGVSSARNKGLLNAQGYYIGFADADDEVERHMYQVLVEAINKYDSDIVCCGSKQISMVDGSSRTCYDSIEGVLSQEEALKALFISPYIIRMSCCTKLFRRDILNDVWFVEGKKYNEDRYFSFCAFAKSNKISIIKNVLYIVHENSESATHQKYTSQRFSDKLFFNRLMYNYLREHYPEMTGYLQADLAEICILSIKEIYRSHNGKLLEDRKFIKDAIRKINSKDIRTWGTRSSCFQCWCICHAESEYHLLYMLFDKIKKRK